MYNVKGFICVETYSRLMAMTMFGVNIVIGIGLIILVGALLHVGWLLV